MTEIEFISSIINEIEGYYNEFTKDFYDKYPNYRFNLRKMNCRQAIVDLNFMECYQSYIREISLYSINKMTNLYHYRYFNHMRVKRNLTILKKLHHNSRQEERYGSFQLQRILNDLFGCRIIMPNVLINKDLIMEHLERLKKRNIIWHYYFRERDGYRAIHCYFRNSNFTFPWELQIWDALDQSDNIYAHLQHEKEREK